MIRGGIYGDVLMSDNLIRYTAAAVGFFLTSVAFYINIGQNMGAKYFMPILLPVIFTLIVLQWANGRHLFVGDNLPNLITAVGWGTAFPIIYTWTYLAAWFMSLVSFDFIIGTAFLVFLASLEQLIARPMNVRPAAALMTLLNFLLLLVPFIEYAYYVMVWHALSPASLMSLYMTNWRESIDFLEANVGVWFLLIAAVIAFLCRMAYHAHIRSLTYYREQPPSSCKSGVLAVLTLLSFYIAFIEYIPDSSVAGLWKDVTSYAEQTAEYGKRHGQRFADLQVDKEGALPEKAAAPQTVIVVIGESASRDYMRAFTPDFPFDDTPWLNEQLNNPDFTVFSHAYSSWSQTVPSLQRALTEQSQYNDKDFLDSVSIIDVAKKAGFDTTAWFSNQGRYGQYDSVTTLIAKTADRAEWTDDSYTFTDKYDIDLLDYLKTVDATKNNFIVFHLIGSHIYYYNRYPYTFAQWTKEDGAKLGEAWADTTPSYANSIRYTDYVLRELFTYARDNLNLAAFLYFSDHGENLHISHNPDVFSFDMVRIPFFIYLSPEYQSLFPDEAHTLKRHREEYFTNDMLYDTLCGILGATKNNRYEKTQDFSSADYGFGRDNLTTMLGSHAIAEDPKE